MRFNIQGIMEKFYVSCPLNMEKILNSEIIEKFEHYNGFKPKTEHHIGGVLIECELEQGLALNLYLRCATRVLLRIKSQKCRDFPKLFKIIQKVNWKKFLKKEEVQWSITTAKSRLINTTKMEKTCSDALKKYFEPNKISQKILSTPEKYHTQKIFIRVENDDLELSIDTSGDALYIRGGEAYRGSASIRATIASCLLVQLLPRNKEVNLLDPMAGSGTFLKEARSFHKVNTNRDFAFFDYSPSPELSDNNFKFNLKEIKGIEIDKEVAAHGQDIGIELGDAFTYKSSNENFVICNPPYGKKVKLSKARDIFYKDLVDCAFQNMGAIKLSMITPLDIKLEGYHKRSKIFNSGIWLYNYIFTKDK
jgi:putative N6-adenine-specific DNA methylase